MPGPRPDDGVPRTLDGRARDIAVHVREETVSIVVLGTGTLTLAPSGARVLAGLLLSGADVFEGGGGYPQFD